MGQEGCHGTETEVFSGVQREAVAILNAPCVNVSQIAAELGIGERAETVAARIAPEAGPGVFRQRAPRDEELAQLLAGNYSAGRNELGKQA